MQIDLSRRGLTDFDASAFSTESERSVLHAIARLNLSSNCLSSLRGLSVLSSLASLDVSHNEVTSLRGLPPSLRELNASSNALQDLDGLQPLRQLEVLHVARNRLANVSALAPLADLHALRVLSLAENAVAQEPQCHTYLRVALPPSLRIDGLSADASRETVSLSEKSAESSVAPSECAVCAAEKAALRREVQRLRHALAVAAGPNANAKTDTNANAKTDTNANAKTDVNADAKTDANADAKTDTNANAKTDTNANAKTDTNANAKTDVNSATAQEPKAEVSVGCGARALAARIMSAVASQTNGAVEGRRQSRSVSFGEFA